MIVRKSQQFKWDQLSLESLINDVYEKRTWDIPDDTQDPLVILMAIETVKSKLEKEDNER